MTAPAQDGKTSVMSMHQPPLRGKVKFFLEAGWGTIVADGLPHDVRVLYTSIETSGFRSLDEGDEVEFQYEDCWGDQNSWHYRTTWVRRIETSG